MASKDADSAAGYAAQLLLAAVVLLAGILAVLVFGSASMFGMMNGMMGSMMAGSMASSAPGNGTGMGMMDNGGNMPDLGMSGMAGG